MNLLPLVNLVISVVMLAGLVAIGMTVLWLIVSDRGYAARRR